VTRDVVAFFIYGAAVLAVTMIHQAAILGVILGVASIVAGREWGRVASKAIRGMLVFNSVVSVSYTAVSVVRGDFSPGYLLLINLRVFTLTFFTALAARRINVLRVVSFSRTLSYVVTLTLGQLVTFRRMIGDFRMAMTSRTIGRATLRDMYRHAASSASFFFLKAMNNVSEITDGMKSRGFFDD